MARVRSTVERAATLHRQAVATVDAAGRALDNFAPERAAASFDAELRVLTARLSQLALAAAPGWLGLDLDEDIADLPNGTALGSVIPVRIGTASPTEDTSFPVVVPLMGAGHLAIEATIDGRTGALLRGVLLRLVAATAPGSLRVRAVDPTGIAFEAFAALHDGRVMPPPATDRAGLRAVLAEAEQWIRTPGQAGRHLLIVIAALPARTDTADLTRLHAVAQQGTAARVTVLIAGDTTLPNATRVTFSGSDGIVSHQGVALGAENVLAAPLRVDPEPPAKLIETVCAQVAVQAKAVDSLSLRDLLPDETWQRDSSAGIATTVGVAGLSTLTVRLDDLTPHWLIGGRSGSGKTALLINVLYGLCSAYSPAELTLYLLDFKEGVSFREFTPSERDPSWIPHTRAVGIESDRAYGLAVLRELEAEMTRRADLFKDAEVTRFVEFRETTKLPRVICVIDEFQVLLAGDDRTARRAVAALESLARKGRSYGIHLILASQTVRGIESLYAKRESIFGQFPVRIALPGGSDVLDVRNDSASALRLGTAVVNTAGGLGGPTGVARAHERLVEFPDPYAEPKTLSSLRRKLFLTRPVGSEPPYVFRGGASARLPAKIARGRRFTAYLGQAIDVPLTPVTFPFDTTPGRHIGVIGPSEMGADLLDAAARSLAAQHAPGTVRFVIAPLVAAADEVGAALATDLAETGHRVEVVDLANLRVTIENRSTRDTYIVVFGIDGVGVDMRWLLREGPAGHAHLVGWWRGLRRFGEDTGGPTGREDVAGVVLLNVPAADAAIFLGDADLDWQPRANRALMHDRHTSRTEMIVPYVRRSRS